MRACKLACCLVGTERRSTLQRMCAAAKHQRKQKQSCLCCHAAPSHVHDALSITAQLHVWSGTDAGPIMAWPCLIFPVSRLSSMPRYMLLLLPLLLAGTCRRPQAAFWHHRCGAMCTQLTTLTVLAAGKATLIAYVQFATHLQHKFYAHTTLFVPRKHCEFQANLVLSRTTKHLPNPPNQSKHADKHHTQHKQIDVGKPRAPSVWRPQGLRYAMMSVGRVLLCL